MTFQTICGHCCRHHGSPEIQMRTPAYRKGAAMRKALYIGCSLLMTTISLLLWYVYGLRVWTVFAGLVLLTCPVFVIFSALREERRTRRDIDEIVRDSRRQPPSR